MSERVPTTHHTNGTNVVQYMYIPLGLAIMAALVREKERAAPERKATLDLGPKAAAVEEETANKAVVNMVEVFIRMIL
jgi:hypothetical protein